MSKVPRECSINGLQSSILRMLCYDNSALYRPNDKNSYDSRVKERHFTSSWEEMPYLTVGALFTTNMWNIEVKKGRNQNVLKAQNSCMMNLLVVTFFSLSEALNDSRISFSNNLCYLSKQHSYSHKWPSCGFVKALIFMIWALLFIAQCFYMRAFQFLCFFFFFFLTFCTISYLKLNRLLQNSLFMAKNDWFSCSDNLFFFFSS